MARAIHYFRSRWSNLADGGHLMNPGEIEDIFDCEPDDIDKSEGVTAADLAVSILRNAVCAVEASATYFHTGVWYEGESDQLNPEDHDGAELLRHTATVVDFSLDEQREIFERFMAG